MAASVKAMLHIAEERYTVSCCPRIHLVSNFSRKRDTVSSRPRFHLVSYQARSRRHGRCFIRLNLEGQTILSHSLNCGYGQDSNGDECIPHGDCPFEGNTKLPSNQENSCLSSRMLRRNCSLPVKNIISVLFGCGVDKARKREELERRSRGSYPAQTGDPKML
jgi:hypothetical protein